MSEVPVLTDKEIDLLSPGEQKRYRQLLLRHIGSQSPLDLACALAPDTRRYPHVEMLNDHIVALVEYRLYEDGPGEPSCLYYTLQDYKSGEQSTLEAADVDDVPYDDPDMVEYFYARPGDPKDRVKLRLGIAMPPRHGKSYMVSEWLPLWYWLRYPQNAIALATYSDEFASSEWGVKLRDKLMEYGPTLGLNLRGGERAPANNPRLESGGRMKLVGIGGALTGFGFQLGLIDDPFKNQDEATSHAVRKAKADWYSSTFATRKTKLRGVIPVEIMMFTRWHEDDIAGRFVYNEDGTVNSEWFMLHLPALAIENDPLSRRLGDPLCPQIMTRDELVSQRTLDPTWFASLYQGMPAVEDGGTFGSFNYFTTGIREGRAVYLHGDDDPVFVDECVRFETVDLAATKKSYSDYSVIGLFDWHRPSQTLYMVDRVKERVESDTHTKWLQRHHDPKAVFVGVESMTFGLTVLQHFRRVGGISVRALKADRDKVSRAIPAADLNRRGGLMLPARAGWLHDFESECAVFPNGRHDDQVDVLSYAVIEALKLPAPIRRVQEELSHDEKGWRQIERNRRRRRAGRY